MIKYSFVIQQYQLNCLPTFYVVLYFHIAHISSAF